MKIYEISVLAIPRISAKTEYHISSFYTVKFTVVKTKIEKNVKKENETGYAVWANTGDMDMCCSVSDTEQEAMKKLNIYMKRAMRGMLLYRTCDFCDTNCFYPETICSACSTFFWPVNKWSVNFIV